MEWKILLCPILAIDSVEESNLLDNQINQDNQLKPMILCFLAVSRSAFRSVRRYALFKACGFPIALNRHFYLKSCRQGIISYLILLSAQDRVSSSRQFHSHFHSVSPTEAKISSTIDQLHCFRQQHFGAIVLPSVMVSNSSLILVHPTYLHLPPPDFTFQSLSPLVIRQ